MTVRTALTYLWEFVMALAQVLPGMISRAPQVGAQVVQPSTTEGNDVNILLKLLQLIPLIAAGVQTIHNDLDSKQKLAQDSLNLAIAGAKVEAPAQADVITGIGQVAQTALTATVAQLHTAATPAPAAA